MAAKNTLPKTDSHARENFRHLALSSTITVATTIIITLISSGYFDKKIANTETTIVHAAPANTAVWTDAKDYYIWFNAQYRNASTIHDKSHFSLMKGNVKFTLILIQPDRKYHNDFQNFMGKFEDMRTYLKRAKEFGDKEGFDISQAFPEIYIFREEKIPSISFFLTKNKENQDKAIFYIEEKGYFIDENRRPIISLETRDELLLKKFEGRYKEILLKAQPHNRLDFTQLVSISIDSTFYLK
ncbi:MAG: hypothetical protein ACKVT2_01025 [Saprospiraceae bacterium]